MLLTLIYKNRTSKNRYKAQYIKIDYKAMMHKNRHEVITINSGVIIVGIRWLSCRCSHRLTDILALRLMDLDPSWPADSAAIWILE